MCGLCPFDTLNQRLTINDPTVKVHAEIDFSDASHVVTDLSKRQVRNVGTSVERYATLPPSLHFLLYNVLGYRDFCIILPKRHSKVLPTDVRLFRTTLLDRVWTIQIELHAFSGPYLPSPAYRFPVSVLFGGSGCEQVPAVGGMHYLPSWLSIEMDWGLDGLLRSSHHRNALNPCRFCALFRIGTQTTNMQTHHRFC